MRFYPLLGLISLSSFELFFVISKILSLHRFSFQFDSCFFLFRRKSQFFRDDYLFLANSFASRKVCIGVFPKQYLP
ncbi:Transposase DDE domain protein [Leptospira santarosai]|uniref:Transposase DDE domain protein n=1 Tax=Leptospira santarosai TaxID=28183 RepID=A0A2P1QQY6_9LEPT|nr:Transposase DDE domain protein [Leptospira santarosai]